MGHILQGLGAAARPQRQSSSTREQRSLLAEATMMMESNDDAVTAAVPSSPLPPPQQLKISHVILDLDGTLIDTGRYSVFLKPQTEEAHPTTRLFFLSDGSVCC